MQHDALIIGGSFAGLSAALQLARAHRSACVVDSGSPRNRFAKASFGVFGRDGDDPRNMIAEARAQLERYPTIQTFQGAAIRAAPVASGFEVTCADGSTLTGARLVLAFGISDILPDIPGLAERWGRSVLHCPYCHGLEFVGQRLGVLYTMPMSVHQALLIADWGPTTLFLNGCDMPDTTVRSQLAQRGIAIEPAPIAKLDGKGAALASLTLADGREAPLDALYLAPRSRLNSPVAEQLGCALDDGPFGPVIRTDAAKATSVPGVYAAGDAAHSPHNASWAMADGVTAGISLHQSLVFDSLAA